MHASGTDYIKFSASNDWLTSVFADTYGVDLDVSVPVVSQRHLPWLLPLLAHDAIGPTPVYEARVKDLGARFDQVALIARLQSVSSSVSIAGLARASSKIVGMVPVERRMGNIIIRTSNYFTNQFTPPAVVDMRRASPLFFALRSQYVSGAGDLATCVKSAFISYAAALTLHPYQDGNGRSFRLLFASDMATFPDEPASYWILILAVFRFLFADQFHLAAKIFRLGDVNMLFDLFCAAQELAVTIFPEDDALRCEAGAARYFSDCYSEFAHRVISVRL